MGGDVQSATAVNSTNSAVPDSQEPAVRVEQDSAGRRRFVISQGIVIEGRIQKPTAFYVLQRSPLTWNLENIRLQLLPKLLESVRRSPF